MLLPVLLVVTLPSIVPVAMSPNELWRANAAEREAEEDWCGAFFYRDHVLMDAHGRDDVYRAFLAAYAADRLQAASALYNGVDFAALELSDDDRAKIERIKADLDSMSPLEDASCPVHAPVCGDAIADDNEACDDGNTDGDDGCSPACAMEVVSAAPAPPPPVLLPTRQPTTAAQPTPAATTTAAPTTATSHATALLVGGSIASGAGVVAVGAGGMFAFANDQTLTDRSSTGDQKDRANGMRTASWIAVGAGAVVAVGGGVLVALSLDEVAR